MRSGGKLPAGHADFATKLYAKLRRLVLLQQVILPHSNIHHDETTVFRDATALRESIEFLGGDVALIDTYNVALEQVLEAAKAFVTRSELNLDMSVDRVLGGKRNEWLSDMHISVNYDTSAFISDVVRARDQTHSTFQNLAARWSAENAKFSDVLKLELNSTLAAKTQALEKSVRNSQSLDPSTALNALYDPIKTETLELLRLMREHDVPQEIAGQKVREFWDSDEMKALPEHRISSYLFAAIARRVVQGQKTIIDKGLINDVRVIAAYAPYVDAMFVDKTCAQLLKEKPLAEELNFKARILSLADPKGILSYLDELESAVPPEVSELAIQIYGLS